MRTSIFITTLFVAICTLYRASFSQLATMGSNFHLVQGQECKDVEAAIEKSITLHSCGSEKSCSYVARLRQGGRFVMITELNELKDAVIDSLWKKEQRVLSNIAVNRDTDSSGAHDLTPSSKAVDGYKGMRYFDNECFSATTTELSPWWRVDLGSRAVIKSVSITNTNNSYMNGTLKNFDIRIGSIDKNGANKSCRENITIAKEVTVNFVCNKGMVGRYVFIEKHRATMILCEVEVYGLSI